MAYFFLLILTWNVILLMCLLYILRSGREIFIHIKRSLSLGEGQLNLCGLYTQLSSLPWSVFDPRIMLLENIFVECSGWKIHDKRICCQAPLAKTCEQEGSFITHNLLWHGTLCAVSSEGMPQLSQLEWNITFKFGASEFSQSDNDFYIFSIVSFWNPSINFPQQDILYYNEMFSLSFSFSLSLSLSLSTNLFIAWHQDLVFLNSHSFPINLKLEDTLGKKLCKILIFIYFFLFKKNVLTIKL